MVTFDDHSSSSKQRGETRLNTVARSGQVNFACAPSGKTFFTHIKPFSHRDTLRRHLAGRIHLCRNSGNQVLEERHRPLQPATGNRISVKSIEGSSLGELEEIPLLQRQGRRIGRLGRWDRKSDLQY